jgi:cellulose synthase/poly-beta-1,6-N-acetylglucosamine synthase-like glycosyltransferase
MIYLFWISLFLLCYTYCVFPISIILISKYKNLNSNIYTKDYELPPVSILIAAYNEEEVILGKVESIFKSDYPSEKIEIIIGSDCSTDRTNEIITKLSNKYSCVSIDTFDKREGKAAVINKLVDKAKNEILILTDANIIFSKKTIYSLARHFKNNHIGLVDSNMINIGIKENGISLQEKTYISSEVQFKHAESKIWGMLMGPFGGCFAIRKSLFEPIPKNFMVDDFFVCMNILIKKKIAINDLDAIVYEDVSNQISEEFRRKRRISMGNFINLNHFKRLLLKPFSKLSFIFVSHKVIRWFGPILLISMLVSNFKIIINKESIFYNICLLIQISLIITPFIDYLLRKIRIHILILRFITHFYIMNLALLIGFIDFLTISKKGTWEPTKRKQDEF